MCCSVFQVQLIYTLRSFYTIIPQEKASGGAECVAVCCSVLQWVAVHRSVLQCIAVCCSVLQCVAVRCSAMQCAAVRCSALQCAAVCCSVLQCVAVCCRALHCVAMCCSVLQGVALCCSVFNTYVYDTPTGKSAQGAVCVAEYCSALQCVAVGLIHIYTTIPEEKAREEWCIVVCCSVLQCVKVCSSVSNTHTYDRKWRGRSGDKDTRYYRHLYWCCWRCNCCNKVNCSKHSNFGERLAWWMGRGVSLGKLLRGFPVLHDGHSRPVTLGKPFSTAEDIMKMVCLESRYKCHVTS